MALQTLWTQHIRDPDKRKDFEKAIRGSTLALGRLLEILKDQSESLDKITEPDFDTPSWSHKEAFRLGQKKQIASIVELLAFLKD